MMIQSKLADMETWTAAARGEIKADDIALGAMLDVPTRAQSLTSVSHAIRAPADGGGIVAFLLADAFISPTPLPKVTLRTQNGELRNGVLLLLRTDASWFILRGTGYEDVPADHVVEATVVGGHEHHGRSLFSRLF